MADHEREHAELRRRLEEAEETLRAIRAGAVDAFVVDEGEQARIYTLETADRPYRLLVEQMQQGAATLDASGAIAYCNRRLAELLGRPHGQLVGGAFRDLVAPTERAAFDRLLAGAGQGEASLLRADGSL
ncbi:MAG: PAS domain-containing protein, partial [Gemmataceae bacterium]|nr:PAS domain-containing protein [Gemmataceae bacterium]